MDGRVPAVALFTAMFFTVGCTSTTKVPGIESPQAVGVITPAQLSPPPTSTPANAAPTAAHVSTSKKWGVGQLFDREKQPQARPDTLVVMANLRVESANEEGRTTMQRDQLLDVARKTYQEALSIDPNHLEALKGLAAYYEATHDHVQARAMYQRAMQAHPKNAQLRHDLAMSFARKKDFETAVQIMTDALNIDPDNRTYRKTYGFCLVGAGKVDEGYAWLARCMPEAEARLNVAQMLFQMGRDEQARQQLTMSMQMNPANPAAQQLLAQMSGAPAPLAPASPQAPAPVQQVQYIETQPLREMPNLQPVPNAPRTIIRTGNQQIARPNAAPSPVLMSHTEDPLLTQTQPFPANAPAPKATPKPVRSIQPLP